jgi:hypothetical protein
MSSLLKEELMLRIDRELRYRTDGVLERLGKLAKAFDIGHQDNSKRSPLRNILLVASDPTASLSTIKTYMRYQAARDIRILRVKSNNPVYQGQRFVDAIIAELDGLETEAKEVFRAIQTSLSETHPLLAYFQTPEHERDVQDLHLRFIQLYLGSLVREHTALVEEAGKKEPPDDRGRENRDRTPPKNPNNPATQRPIRRS